MSIRDRYNALGKTFTGSFESEDEAREYAKESGGLIFEGNANSNPEDRLYHSLLPEATVVSNKWRSSYNDGVKDLLFHGIPDSVNWLEDNSIGHIGKALPVSITKNLKYMSSVLPSKVVGTIGNAINGKWVSPWDSDNKGWSTLVGDEYGEALNFYGDRLPIFGVAGKLASMGKLGKVSRAVSNAASNTGLKIISSNRLLSKGKNIYDKVDDKIDSLEDNFKVNTNNQNFDSFVNNEVISNAYGTVEDNYDYYKNMF